MTTPSPNHPWRRFSISNGKESGLCADCRTNPTADKDPNALPWQRINGRLLCIGCQNNRRRRSAMLRRDYNNTIGRKLK